MHKLIKNVRINILFVGLSVLFLGISAPVLGHAYASPSTLIAASTVKSCGNNSTPVTDKAGNTTCQISTSCDDPSGALTTQNCGIINYLIKFIDILSAIVGLTVVIMIILGGIQYSAAGDDPQKVSEAKKKISNALLALFVFIFMFAFLQWVVPGGIF